MSGAWLLVGLAQVTGSLAPAAAALLLICTGEEVIPLSPEEIVDGQLAAYNARDLDQFLGFYVDEVPVHAFPSGKVLTDRSGPAFRDRYRELFEASPDLHAELVSRVVRGHIVIDQERATGFMGGEASAVAIYEVGQDKIERVWFVT